MSLPTKSFGQMKNGPVSGRLACTSNIEKYNNIDYKSEFLIFCRLITKVANINPCLYIIRKSSFSIKVTVNICQIFPL